MASESLENTPTWAVSVVVLILYLVSMLIEALLHLLEKFLKKRKRKSLIRALEKIKSGLMQMGFISLLLTIGQEPISRICVNKSVGDSFLPCQDISDHSRPLVASATQISGSNATGTGEEVDVSSCEAKGKVSFISKDGIQQLHIFIIVLAVFHVLYCVLTMFLGLAKMRRWKRWEKETRTLYYQIANDPRRFMLTKQTSFGQRHIKSWSRRRYLLWPACFLRQFMGSVTKADYFVLRNGFIAAHLSESSDFDFQKFLGRAFDNDFEMVVGISIWIWIFSILFIFFGAHGFYSHFWLPFIPLMMVLIINTKLQVTITLMCLKAGSRMPVVKGVPLVEPSDSLFWFNRPDLLLPLLHFILFQNSFQLAFFCWAWYEYGIRSCFHRETEDIVLCVAIGVVTQLLCGYVTLPLYALVAQMGSEMKKAVFTETVTRGLKKWHSLACRNLHRTNSSKKSLSSQPLLSENTAESETPLPDVQEMGSQAGNGGLGKAENAPPVISQAKDEMGKGKSQPQGMYHDGEVSFGEISFGTSWKAFEGDNIKSGEIISETDDVNSDST